MKTKALVAAACLAMFAAIPIANAQGIVGGAQEGAARGNRAAGPVGGVVGGAVGAGVGGVVGGVKGVIGVPDERAGVRRSSRQTRNARRARARR